MTWYKGRAYGVSRDLDRVLRLFTSTDGLNYDLVCILKVSDEPNETTLRFLPDGKMIGLVRREGGNKYGWIGWSKPPYKEWNWHETQYRLGGPNFIILPNGEMWAGSRSYFPETKTKLYKFGLDSYEPVLTLPSGGDTSYPGFVWYEGALWMSYYSSHEGKASIYLAKIELP